MNKLDQTVDEYLRAIGASCPRLLFALQQSPETVWGEIMRVELACHAFEEVCAGLQDKSAAAHEIMTLVQALRTQMAKDGLIDYDEFAAFRQSVSAIQCCANRLRNSFGEGGPGSNRPLKTCVFYCSNNLDARRLADLGEEVGGDTVKAIGLPCSGKVDVLYLLKALETGADGVVIVACRKKECRHFEGSLRAHKRAEAVESLLEEIGRGAGRMAVIECAQGGAGQVCNEIKQFIERVRSLPPSVAPSSVVNKQECRLHES
jgi:F420-non-reducing hydrogenase iron-sulfur subunit